jgi:hypothetical protein
LQNLGASLEIRPLGRLPQNSVSPITFLSIFFGAFALSVRLLLNFG